tara:strand:- start:44 stop:868 length:825 start_codon:yes stop_codon:yes gene_type:complete
MEFNADGFSLGDEGSVNNSGGNLVAWCWKAGNGTVVNTDGEIRSNVSVNQDAGFSIVSYNGSSTAFSTVGHGLSQAPEFIMIKNRTNTYGWAVYHHKSGLTGTTLDGAAEYYMLIMNTTSARSDHGSDNIWDSNASTWKMDGTGGANWVNNSNSRYIAYCWHSVEGFSKFGGYEGNNNANGPFVYLGFKPALVILKNIDATYSWAMYDSRRSPQNLSTIKALWADTTSAEGSYSTVDFLSNGFKIRDSSATINAAQTYVYMAWAEMPYKYATAR